MNLRNIANKYTSTINPNIPATLKANDGYTVDDTGKRVPKFIEEPVAIQIQSLTSQDLAKIESFEQQGQYLNVYVTGQFHVLRRLQDKGADKLIFTSFGENGPSEWLIKQVAESWSQWCKVIVWRQH